MLLEIRREMALEADYDVDLFVEIVRKRSTQIRPGVSPEFCSTRESIEDASQIAEISETSENVRRN